MIASSQAGTCCTSGELGIALSGGGARGFAQLGVLKVLEREEIPVSYVAGTSAGAIIGAVYVTSSSASEAEEKLLAQMARTEIPSDSALLGMLGLAPESGPRGLFALARGLWHAVHIANARDGSRKLLALLEGLLGEASFADARLPFATTALDLASGRRLIFSAGRMIDAVYASSAIPGLFEPYRVDGHILVDGGWAEPVPVGTCHHLGAIHIVAVDVLCSSEYGDTRALSAALRADTLTRQLLEEEQLRSADFVVRLELPRGRLPVSVISSS